MTRSWAGLHTAKTGQRAFRNTFSVTDPSVRWSIPRRPWVPMTIRFTACASAKPRIKSVATPSLTLQLGLDPCAGHVFPQTPEVAARRRHEGSGRSRCRSPEKDFYEREGPANLSRAARTEWPCNAKPATAHSHKPSPRILRNQLGQRMRSICGIVFRLPFNLDHLKEVRRLDPWRSRVIQGA